MELKWCTIYSRYGIPFLFRFKLFNHLLGNLFEGVPCRSRVFHHAWAETILKFVQHANNITVFDFLPYYRKSMDCILAESSWIWVKNRCEPASSKVSKIWSIVEVEEKEYLSGAKSGRYISLVTLPSRSQISSFQPSPPCSEKHVDAGVGQVCTVC